MGVKEQDQHHHQHKVAVELKRKGVDQISSLLKVSVLSYLIFVVHRPLLDLEHQLPVPPLQVVIVGPMFGVEVVIGGHAGDRLL